MGGNRPQQHLISKHNGSDVTLAILKLNMKRTNIRADLPLAIRRGNFLLESCPKFQLVSNVQWNAKKGRSRIRHGLNFNGAEHGIFWRGYHVSPISFQFSRGAPLRKVLVYFGEKGLRGPKGLKGLKAPKKDSPVP